LSITFRFFLGEFGRFFLDGTISLPVGAGLLFTAAGGAGGIVEGGAEEGMKLGGGPGGEILGALLSFPFSPVSPFSPLGLVELLSGEDGGGGVC
jgi:hypothetical protein